MLKASKYNFWARLEGNRHLLFNGMSGALYELDDEERRAALSILRDPDRSAHQALFPSLKDGGFLIPATLDEVEKLIIRNQTECAQHEILDLTISPTYECNFRCRYCYVHFNKGRMSSAIEERVIRYIERALPVFRQVNISWFGGEPLLCLDTVCRMSAQITDMASRQGVKLYTFITSNGFLLELDTALALYGAGIRFFHVTIDGPEGCHDQLRTPADGRPTYSRILENVMALLANIPDAHLTLRMNANEDNISSCCEVLDVVPPAFRGRVQVNITPIIYEDKAPSPQLYREINRAIRYALDNGYLYYDMQIPVNRRTFCMADKLHNFQIGPDGALHKCSPSGKPEVHVGMLDEQGTPQFNANYAAWHTVPEVRESCLSCPYLCFCPGGCRLERLRGASAPGCRIKYEDIEAMIVNRYLALVKGSFEAAV